MPGATAKPEGSLVLSTADESSPDQAFRTYYHEVYRGLQRLDVPEALLDDAAQDVFLIAYRRWTDFEWRSSVRTWIWGIATRVAKDYRKRKLSYERKVRELRYHPFEGPVTPESLAERSEAARLVLQLLKELPIPEREVLVCVELEGFSVATTAKLLGIPTTTAHSRHHRAKDRFNAAARRLFVNSQADPASQPRARRSKT